jgi:hypothetical protein
MAMDWETGWATAKGSERERESSGWSASFRR